MATPYPSSPSPAAWPPHMAGHTAGHPHHHLLHQLHHHAGGVAPGGGEMRSVTPATNNTRYPAAAQPQHHQQPQQARYGSDPRAAGGGVTPTTTVHPSHGAPSPAAAMMMSTTVGAAGTTDPYAAGGAAGGTAGAAAQRALTPSRYLGAYHRQDDTLVAPNTPSQQQPGGSNANNSSEARTPSSTGLIRLTLKKPMGIVFEPMYDPHQPSLQRGVRICDLPRTGAAALSRKLQVGDELLQINDTTVSRLTFDEIMDFIIDADPEAVNLLFRRPRKETLQARQGVPQKLNAAASKDNPSTVKWVDEERGGGSTSVASYDKKQKKDRKGGSSSKKRESKRSKNKKEAASEEDETIQSSTVGDDSVANNNDKNITSSSNNANKNSTSRRKKKSSSSRRNGGGSGANGKKNDPYEQESFLDLLIDAICSNSNNVCRDAFRRPEDEYSDEEEESFVSEEEEETYATNDESVERRNTHHNSKKGNPSSTSKKQSSSARIDDEDTTNPDSTDLNPPRSARNHHHHSSHHKDKPDGKTDKQRKYEDDGTLETVDTNDRPKADEMPSVPQPVPLGLDPQLIMAPPQAAPINLPAAPVTNSDTDDEGNPAPITELEYDDRIDHGADVSVMESLGGPSLLIEKQRAAAAAQAAVLTQSHHAVVPTDVMESFGLDYPVNFGMTRDQTIHADPLRFYTYVVKALLEQHEPEKVRLLDKLLAKYRGREDHLVRKLSVRYTRSSQGGNHAGGGTPQPDDDDEGNMGQGGHHPASENDAAFHDAVQKSKTSLSAAAAVNTARERMQQKSDYHHHHSSAAAGHHLHHPPEQYPRGFRDGAWPEKEQKEPDQGDDEENEEEDDEEGEEGPEEEEESGSDYSKDSVDGTSPAVIAQVSELLNYVYGKTSVPGQIDRVSTIMRAYEGREAVLLELLETKALIKANKEKENADNLPSFLRNTHLTTQAQKNAEELQQAAVPGTMQHHQAHGLQQNPHHHHKELPAVMPIAATNNPHAARGSTVMNDDISSMSGISSPAAANVETDAAGVVISSHDEVEVPVAPSPAREKRDPAPTKEAPQINATMMSGTTTTAKFSAKPPATPDPDRKKKKGIFGGLFGGKKKKEALTPGSRARNGRKM